MKIKKTLSLALASIALICSCNKSAETTDNAAAKSSGNVDCMKKVYAMFESGNTEGIEGCVGENMVDHNPDPSIKSTGLQALKDAIAMNHTAFPDMKTTILNVAEDGNVVMVHFNMKGTNSGSMMGMPATNKSVDVNGVDIVRFENGKGVEHWGYFDMQKMMEQLGMPQGGGAMPADTTHKM